MSVILDRNSRYKNYIYKSDISSLFGCGHEEAVKIYDLVKEYELEVMGIEMFENRVPQDLFHEWRNMRKKKK